MKWEEAFRRALTAVLFYILFGLIGFVAIAIGFTLTTVGTASSIGEDSNFALIGIGGILIVIGYIWVFIAGFAVMIKVGAEAVADLVNRRKTEQIPEWSTPGGESAGSQ